MKRLTWILRLLLVQAVVVQAQDSFDARVQGAYIAYYGRPGDAAGITFWADELAAENGNLDAIIDAFGDSTEFQERFGSLDNTALVENIYQQLLGRAADPEGLTFYVGNLQNGSMTLATVALNIADGARPGTDDFQLIENKRVLADEFSSAVVAAGLRYSLEEVDAARAVLDAVTANPDSLDTARVLMASTLEDFPLLSNDTAADTRRPSVARLWNEVLLTSIRNDLARPTVHARNLFHVAAAAYDAWSVFEEGASTYLLGKEVAGFSCPLDEFAPPEDIQAAREQAISHASYRLLRHRFSRSPGFLAMRNAATALMTELGYDINDTSTDYSQGSASALGNAIANCYIEFGAQDGANESADYANRYYIPANPAIQPDQPGNPNIIDLDRWQPISLMEFIDQSGNVINSEPEFLSAEWGNVVPFSLTESDRTVYSRDGFDYPVYFDPGSPPSAVDDTVGEYKWGFSLVSIWSAHLDPGDGVMIDISPASIGNIEQFPTSFADYSGFYDYLQGGDASQGWDNNPTTGAPYEPQVVPRADYARVLAEFWADGPDSETPPGHWFVIHNEVSDHELFERRFGGTGPLLGPLEWDIKAYFAIGGAMHDSAIAAWSIKGWYDYLRPVSAIRAMADRGQSSDDMAASYSPDGIPLVDGLIELVAEGDPLAGSAEEHLGKIKLYAWRGPDFIADPATDQAGVGWILAENWWPYQRPSFVTPPFAGYVSGHSTFSRAAAEVMTALTGSAFFPGGMSGFEIKANEFLVFEEGPSVDLTLQWATYRDASDQTSLSRIWGGIHPPADDIPGRLIGEQIGLRAFSLAKEYFAGER